MESEESDVEIDVAGAIGDGRRDKGKKDIVCNVCNRVYALNRCLNIFGDCKKNRVDGGQVVPCRCPQA